MCIISMHEPDEYSGEAHLLDHIPLLGNPKYPVEILNASLECILGRRTLQCLI